MIGQQSVLDAGRITRLGCFFERCERFKWLKVGVTAVGGARGAEFGVREGGGECWSYVFSSIHSPMRRIWMQFRHPHGDGRTG